MATILGTAGSDTLHGTSADDLIKGGGGDDVLHSGGGHDSLVGGDGNDIMFSDNGIVDFYGGAGIDTADFSGAIQGVAVDLAAGKVSYVGWFGPPQVGLSHDITGVENVTGSAFNDKIWGDAGDNVITGGGGGDTLHGGGGHDQLYGGDGNDTMFSDGGIVDFYGGAGIDTVDFSGALYGVDVELGPKGAVSYVGWFFPGQIHDLKDVENANGSAFNDKLRGDSGDNVIDRGAGNDGIWSGGGKDTLRGGDGDDTLYSDAGTPSFDGGTGVDTVDFSGRPVGVDASLLVGTVTYAGNKSLPQLEHFDLVNVENLNGTAFDDSLSGDNGNNVLRGNGGHDALWGNGGADTFVYDAHNGVIDFGTDWIFDFQPGQDHVQFDHTIFADYAAVQAHMQQIGNDTVISFDGSNSVTLLGVHMANLHAGDFVFV